MPAARRTRSGVADLTTVVLTLHAQIGDCFLFGNTFSYVSGIRGDVVHHPMREAAWTRRIRVVDHEGKCLGLRGRVHPGKLGRDVLTLASVLGGNCSSRLKSRTGQLHFVSPMHSRNHSTKRPVAFLVRVDNQIPRLGWT